jgi:hypothetical protein
LENRIEVVSLIYQTNNNNLKLKTMTTKKITMASVKSFVKKNFNGLYIKLDGSFDGMIDGIDWKKDSQFVKADLDTQHYEHTLGIKGAWFVGRSNDFFTKIENESFEGIKVSNSCGYFTIAIKK